MLGRGPRRSRAKPHTILDINPKWCNSRKSVPSFYSVQELTFCVFAWAPSADVAGALDCSGRAPGNVDRHPQPPGVQHTISPCTPRPRARGQTTRAEGKPNCLFFLQGKITDIIILLTHVRLRLVRRKMSLPSNSSPIARNCSGRSGNIATSMQTLLANIMMWLRPRPLGGRRVLRRRWATFGCSLHSCVHCPWHCRKALRISLGFSLPRRL